MFLKGACTNLLREKFSRTFGEKVGGAAARMRCRAHSVRHLNNFLNNKSYGSIIISVLTSQYYHITERK